MYLDHRVYFVSRCTQIIAFIIKKFEVAIDQ